MFCFFFLYFKNCLANTLLQRVHLQILGSDFEILFLLNKIKLEIIPSV